MSEDGPGRCPESYARGFLPEPPACPWCEHGFNPWIRRCCRCPRGRERARAFLETRRAAEREEPKVVEPSRRSGEPEPLRLVLLRVLQKPEER